MVKKRKRRRPHIYRRSPPGSPPGTFVIDPQAPKPKISVYHYSVQDVEEHLDSDLQVVKRLKEKPGVLWVNIDGTGDVGIVRELESLFGLHRLTLEDVVHLHQRTKVEAYRDYLYVVVNVLEHTDSLFSREQISFILGNDFLVTVQERPGDSFEPVRKRIREDIGKFRGAGPDHLFYALVDTVIDNYFPIAEDLAHHIDSLENQILAQSKTNLIETIHRLKVDVTMVNRMVWYHTETLNALIREPGGFVKPDTVFYLRDCLDHAMQLQDFTGRYREAASNLMDLYISIGAYRSNEIMRVLTIIASIFIPLTFIAGIYGMNFDPATSPWNMPELRWAYGYPFSLLLMLLVAVAMLIYFRRKNWLGGGGSTSFSRPVTDKASNNEG